MKRLRIKNLAGPQKRYMCSTSVDLLRVYVTKCHFALTGVKQRHRIMIIYYYGHHFISNSSDNPIDLRSLVWFDLIRYE